MSASGQPSHRMGPVVLAVLPLALLWPLLRHTVESRMKIGGQWQPKRTSTYRETPGAVPAFRGVAAGVGDRER